MIKKEILITLKLLLIGLRTQKLLLGTLKSLRKAYVVFPNLSIQRYLLNRIVVKLGEEMEKQNAKSIREVGNKEKNRSFDGLRRRDENEKVSDFFVTKLKRTAAVVGLASALYFAP